MHLKNDLSFPATSGRLLPAKYLQDDELVRARNQELRPLITQFVESFVRVPKAAPRRWNLAADGCHLAQEVVVL